MYGQEAKMNYQTQISACDSPVSESELQYAAQGLENNLRVLQSNISVLAERLNVVLTEDCPAPTSASTVGRNITSKIGLGIQDASFKIYNANCQIENLLRRLAI